MSLQHRLLSASAAVALLLAACGDPATLETSTTTVPGASTTTSTAPASTTSSTTSTTVAPDPDGPGPSGASTEELAALVDVTEQIRGLEFLVDPTVTVISGEDMADRVRQDLEEEIDPAEIVIDEAFFELIGILPADIDLAQAWIDLYSEQVAGFYDHEA
jgi:hypothetical protein